jgi:predicted transposase/invertase (TIGR01784 family)
VSARQTLDPTLDVVFKMLLTSRPESPRLLVSLLTAVLRPPSPFAKVVVRNPELPSTEVLERGVVLDIAAELADGTLLDIEMQSDKRPAFRERALFYWARLYGAELERGEGYEALRPVISVLFLDYRELRGQRLHSVFHVLELHDHERFSDALALHVIELPKIPQATAEERADEASLLRWSRFFAAQTDAELEEIAMADPVIAEARNVLQAVSDDPTAREIARLRANAQVVRRLEEAALRQEGREEGIKEGIKEGRAEALRRAIEGLCLALGVPLDAAMRAALADRDAEALQALFDALVRDRAWPS